MPVKTFPPDKWVPSNGAVWGTDMDASASVVSSGSHSLHFKNTTPAADPELVSQDFIPVEASEYYMGECTRQADSTTAGNTVGYLIDWYQIDHTASTVTATSTIINAVVNATGTWETETAIFQAPSDAAFAKKRLTKNNTAFNAYFDSAILKRAVPMWDATKTGSGQSINASSLTTVVFNSATTYGVSFNTSTGVATIQRGGWYSINFHSLFSTMSSGDRVQVYLYVNGTLNRTGQNETCGGAFQSIRFHGVQYFSRGDTVEIRIIQVSSGAKSLSYNLDHHFTGVRVE